MSNCGNNDSLYLNDWSEITDVSSSYMKMGIEWASEMSLFIEVSDEE
jgi:hypothetical protein